MKRSRVLAAPLLLLLSGALALALRADDEALTTTDVPRAPRLDPDYADVVVPPNMAPLNFVVREPAQEVAVTIRGAAGPTVEVRSSSGQVRIPEDDWRALLQANRGQTLQVEVRTRDADGAWQRFAPVTQHVAADSIDAYLAYRLLKPLYNLYVDIGIYQRQLGSFAQTTILHNRNADRACLNCHSFAQNRPDPMVLHTRGSHGLTMLVARGDRVTTVDTRTPFNKSPAAYTAWHPDGRHIGFSVNKVSLFFHTDPTQETREVFDAGSDLAVYDTQTNILTTTPAIADPGRAETWPEWSPDGRTLYFSSAPVTPIEDFRRVRYDLMRIAWDPETGAWGQLDTVLTAAATGKTVCQPKVSPDGRWLVFTMAEHGNFPIFSASADLYAMDLRDGSWRRLEINSDAAADSWHAWSSNGRWLVFSSKRRDGLFARPYFSYVDAEGRFHKPLLLPQEDPTFYDSFVETYNVPVFVTGPVEVDQRALGRAVYDPQEPRTAQLDPQVAAWLAERGPAGAADEAVEPYVSGTAR